MKDIKLRLKIISMSLVTALIFTFSLTPFASAKENSESNVPVSNEQAEQVLKEIEGIENIEFLNEKEDAVKKEMTLVIDGEESQITYDKQEGTLYVDGQLAVTDMVIEEGNAPAPEITTRAAVKKYTIGTNRSDGVWTYKTYRSGSFNVVTLTVAAVVGIISIILTKKPAASAVTAAAGGILSSLMAIDQYQVSWSLFHYEAKNKKGHFNDSVTFLNWKRDKFAQIQHYYGVV